MNVPTVRRNLLLSSLIVLKKTKKYKAPLKDLNKIEQYKTKRKCLYKVINCENVYKKSFLK